MGLPNRWQEHPGATEAKKPGKGEATIKVDWDHGKPNPSDERDWADLGVYLVKAKRNELELEGKKENLVTWLWDFYGWDMKDIEREYKELFRWNHLKK